MVKNCPFLRIQKNLLIAELCDLCSKPLKFSVFYSIVFYGFQTSIGFPCMNQYAIIPFTDKIRSTLILWKKLRDVLSNIGLIKPLLFIQQLDFLKIFFGKDLILKHWVAYMGHIFFEWNQLQSFWLFQYIGVVTFSYLSSQTESTSFIISEFSNIRIPKTHLFWACAYMLIPKYK